MDGLVLGLTPGAGQGGKGTRPSGEAGEPDKWWEINQMDAWLTIMLHLLSLNYEFMKNGIVTKF